MHKVYRTIEGLPPEGIDELVRFVDLLKSKYSGQQPREVVALGGLWKNSGLDVTNSEVRALRQRVTEQLLRKV